MKDVKVHGPGDKRCGAAAEMVKEAAERVCAVVTVDKVTDPPAIAMAGAMSTPGLGPPDAARVEAWRTA